MKVWKYGFASVSIVIAAVAASFWFGFILPRKPDGELTCSVVLQAVADESALHREALGAGTTPVYSEPVAGEGSFHAPSGPLRAIDLVSPNCVSRAHKAGYLVRSDYAISIPMIHIEPNGREVEVMFFQRCGGVCGVGGLMTYQRIGTKWRQIERHVSVMG